MKVRKLNESKLNEKYKHVNSLCAGDIIDDDGTQRTVKSIEDKSKFIQVKFKDGTSSNYDTDEQVKVVNECMTKSKRITETTFKESMEGKYCIVALTNDGKFKFYRDGVFVDDYKKATIFTDMDEARSEWFDINKSKYKRVFIPNYDESHLASLNGNKEDGLDEAFKIGADDIQYVRVVNPYNYTIQELRIDNTKKTFERGNFTMGKADKKTKNRQEYEDVVDKLKAMGYTEIPSDYRSLRNKTRKGVPTNENKSKSIKETYWIDNKEVMAEVDRLVKELDNLGWKWFDDKYTGSKYYTIFRKRDENGKGMFKAVKYSHTHTPEIVDLTYEQVAGEEPLDSFDGLRKKLGKALLPKNENKSFMCESNVNRKYNDYITMREINWLKDNPGQEIEKSHYTVSYNEYINANTNEPMGGHFTVIENNSRDNTRVDTVQDLKNYIVRRYNKYFDPIYEDLDHYTHFKFTSGANPYIAKTSKEANRLIKKYGDKCKFQNNTRGIDYYTIDDSDNMSDFFMNESTEEDTPYTKARINKEIKALTNNFTVKDGVARTAFEKEKDYAIDILSKHYKHVEVSGDEYNDYRIAYDTPLKNLNEDSNDVLTLSEIPDNRKWQYSIAGRDVPYTEYEDAKKHFKDEFKITDYREELQEYIDKETGHKGYYFVDETFDDRLVVSVSYGDWKHDHLYLDNLVREFFSEKGLYVEREEEVTSDTDDDVYSADHYYELSDFVLSGRPIKESLLQDIKTDHENIKSTWGEEVYNALNDYVTKHHKDLGTVMSKEKEWKKFEKWAKKKGIKFNKKDNSFESQLGERCDMKLSEKFTDNDREALKVEIMDAVSNFVIDKYGDEDWMEYVVVEVVPTNDNRIKVEVRTEFGYKTMTELSNKLDRIIRKYDRHAYFEHEDYGIINAFINKDESKNKIDRKLFNSFKSIINSLNTPDECRDFYVKEIKPLQDSSFISEATYDAIADYLINRFDTLESKSANESLNEASYGGAYDISNDQYFTKDDIVEFADNVVDVVNTNTDSKFNVSDINMETPTKLYIELEDEEHGTVSTRVKIDFRKVRKPSDLIKVYAETTANKLISMI